MTEPASLFRQHVFLDLETTGLDPVRDEVIEVGMLFVRAGAVVGRFEQLFSPSAPVPPAITALTGLTDRDVEGRPRFKAFRRELRARLRGWTAVAHNASFERAFLAEELQGPVLDSCELMHYLHPELESHSLDASVRWAQVAPRASHRALRDCEDTFSVLCHAFGLVLHERRLADLTDLLMHLAPGVTTSRSQGYPLVALLEQLAQTLEEPTSERWRPRARRSAGPTPTPTPTPSSPTSPTSPTAPTHAECAARAYLSAFQRRHPSPTPEKLSHWFKEHFPSLSLHAGRVAA